MAWAWSVRNVVGVLEDSGHTDRRSEMLSDEMRAQVEQELMFMKEILPKAWWGLYEGCVKEGFSEVQALELVKAYIQKPAIM